jgi:hypothetical protein
VSEIIGAGPAAAVLEALLSSVELALRAAQGASAVDQLKAIEAAKKRLTDFADGTRAQDLANADEVKAVREIDRLALDAISVLTVIQASVGAAALQEGADQLKTLTGALNVETANVTGAAKSISLQPVKKAVDTMTAMVNSVKFLKANLNSADVDEAKVITEIDNLVDQFEALRDAVTGNG